MAMIVVNVTVGGVVRSLTFYNSGWLIRAGYLNWYIVRREIFVKNIFSRGIAAK